MEVFACDVILVGSLGTIITEMEEITFETLHEVQEFICRMRIGKICLSPKFVRITSKVKESHVQVYVLCFTSATPYIA